jgi:hypothetical protein
MMYTAPGKINWLTLCWVCSSIDAAPAYEPPCVPRFVGQLTPWSGRLFALLVSGWRRCVAGRSGARGEKVRSSMRPSGPHGAGLPW